MGVDDHWRAAVRGPGQGLLLGILLPRANPAVDVDGQNVSTTYVEPVRWVPS